MAEGSRSPTFEKLMDMSFGEIRRLIESGGQHRQLIFVEEKLWPKLPFKIRDSVDRADFAKEIRAHMSVALAQAEFWRTMSRFFDEAIEKLGLTGDVEDEMWREVNERLRLKEESLSRTIRRKLSRQRQAIGGEAVRSDYPWLKAKHKVPVLQKALGLSDEGLRLLIKRLKIRKIRSQAARTGPSIVDRSGALMLLSARLDRPRIEGVAASQAIWTDYGASLSKNTPGLRRLKSILVSHGAKIT